MTSSRLAALLLLCLLPGAAAAQPTGLALPGLEAFDEAMATVMARWQVPGAALAVAKDGRLVLAHGYGETGLARRSAVQPTSLFRLGSLTKTVTAVAVLKLVDDGRLALDDPILPILGDLGPRPGRVADPRVRDITVRHLLQHTGGWDRGVSGDPPFMPHAAKVAARQGVPMPPDCRAMLRDALERPLDFAPGERHAYSNVGYCMLGRVVEKVSGLAFERFVRERILAPAGAHGLQWGRTLLAAPGEVTYHDEPGAGLVRAMPGVASGQVAQPYGAFALESMDAFGSLIGAPVDYLRFVLAIDGRRGAALLSPAAVREMQARPAIRGTGPEAAYYALGVHVRVVPGGLNVWHPGSQPGMSALALRNADGSAWVVAFNTRPRDRAGFHQDYDRALQGVRARVRGWPAGDLFDRLP